MFTGIVEERGVVRELGTTRLSVGCRTVASDATEGASIAVNGACLTVVERSDEHLAFDVSEETLRRTSFSRLRAGDRVNLERSLTLSSRLGGHLVQGHVDGVGEVVAIDLAEDRSAWITVRAPERVARYLVDKGSVCVDGVSLTVASRDGETFGVALIPHTLEVTTLGTAEVGDPLNLEVDVIAKYVEALLGPIEGRMEGKMEGTTP
ncbi:MAG TPA: riboflavin synthase [Actinomycetota bacterium]|nr:riboflavin synthase [Actinomycetota bacterium]